MHVRRKWTEFECPWPWLNDGHTRQECERIPSGPITGTSKKAGKYCFYRRKEVEAARETRRHRDRSHSTLPNRWPRVWPVKLTCGHTVHYRTFSNSEPLYCVRCDDWVKQMVCQP